MRFPPAEEMVKQLDEGIGDGPLTLGIFCTRCNAQFELSRESAAMAMITGTSFMEYLKFVQSSGCPNCKKD